MRYLMLSDKGWDRKMVDEILTRVRHLMVDVNLTLTSNSEEYGIDNSLSEEDMDTLTFISIPITYVP